MDAFGEIIRKFLDIASILLCLIISLNWFQKRNTDAGGKNNKFFTAIKIFAVMLLIAVCASDVIWYVQQLSDPKGKSLVEILLVHFE